MRTAHGQRGPRGELSRSRDSALIAQRSALITALGGLLFALCLPVQAQQPSKVSRIGYLQAPPASAVATRTDAFRQGLRELGYVEGKNIVIEWRFAEGKLDRVPELVAEFVRLKVDVIITGGSFATGAAKQATSAIPVVMTQDSDPVGIRLGMGMSPASRGPGATSLDCPHLPLS